MSNISTMHGMRPLAVVGLASAASALCVALCPGTALAYSDVAWSYDGNGQIKATYASIDEALQAGYSGEEIWMSRDWELSEPLAIEAGKSITINMNGRIIKSTTEKSAITVGEGAHFTLMSTNNGELAYKGYTRVSGTRDWTLTDMKIDSGGLVTNNNGRGIDLDAKAELTLGNVTVAGNSKGGINCDDRCTVSMKNHASVQNNSSYYGGGVALDTYCTLNMDNSSITQNFAEYAGAGVYVISESNSGTIDLENNSKINDNMASAGGGVYLSGDFCTVVSKDKTGSISGNTAFSVSNAWGSSASQENGGGIHVDNDEEGCSATIQGVTVANNYSALNAGGIEVNQGNTSIVDCTITGNVAAKAGGGVYLYAKDCTLKDCTITGNTCNDIGNNYEGGGVFVESAYDVSLSGVCVIKGNTRGKNGSADDLFLSSDFGGKMKAYIVGSVDKDSKIGVRTDITGTRTIARGLSNNCYGAFFIDLPGYYVGYEHDTYGNAQQNTGALAFAACLNGKGTGRYSQDTTVTIDGSSKDNGKVFWYWDAKKTTGLYPVSEFINDTNKYNPLLTFAMPQNDVNAVPVYADKIEKASVELEAPKAGEPLPATATLKRTDGGNGGSNGVTGYVTWYKVRADGGKVAVSGNAKPGTTYEANVTFEQDQKAGIVFYGGELKAKTVTVGDVNAAAATVSSATGTLTVQTAQYKTDGAASADDNDDGKVIIYPDNSGLQAILDGSDMPVHAAKDSSMGDPIEVYYSEGSDSVTITAPSEDGFNFCNWEGIKDGWVNDDVEGVLTIPAEDLTDGLEITAVYTPVIAKLEVGLSTPKAGEKLSTKATSLTAVGSDGETLDLMDALGKKSLSVEWAPGDKKASYSTAYAAIVELTGAEGMEDPEGTLAQDATVTLSDGTQSACANFAVFENKLCLLLLAPDTEGVKSVTGLKAKKAGKGTIKVSWKKAARSGVQVRYSTAKTMKGAKKALAKGKAVKAKKVKKLKSGKRYYFQARSYVTVNGQKCYSAWSKKVSVKVK